VTVMAGAQRTRVAGTTLGRHHRPHLVEAWGQRFNLQFADDYMVLFRYRDMPGMIGRAGTSFGAHGVNINAAAVGHVPEEGGNGGIAVMVLTTDAPVPEAVLDEILSGDGFFDGRFVTLR
jgi:D-3-phosphoglycerate dehydrogenase / 2-oxoglutarate reductase